MDRIELTPGLSTSRLGFGCAGLLQLPARRDRAAVVAAVLDAGITHFDVARMYGLGAAERELGRLLGARRDEVTIATKFGIDAPSFGPLSRLQAPARALLRRYPGLRSAVKRRATEVYDHRTFTAPLARASFETSLAELGTDHVDVLFLHGPSPQDEIDAGPLLAFLDAALADGRSRAWGVSGEAGPSLAVLERDLRPDAICQLADSVLEPTRAAVLAGRPISAFGVINGALPTLLGALRAPAVRGRWRDALDLDPTPGALVTLLLQDAVAANPDGLVLFSSTDPQRVRAAATAVDAPPDRDRIAALRGLVADLPGTPAA